MQVIDRSGTSQIAVILRMTALPNNLKDGYTHRYEIFMDVMRLIITLLRGFTTLNHLSALNGQPNPTVPLYCFLTLRSLILRKVVQISARNTKVYKICEICRAIFSSFYNISRPNYAILLILICSF